MLEILLSLLGAALLKAAALAPLIRLRHKLTHIEVDHGEIVVTGDQHDAVWTFNQAQSRFSVDIVREVKLTNGSGLLGYIDNKGMLRTERGHAEPVISEPIGSVDNVIDLAGRRSGE